MKFIRRWGLMHTTYPENIQEHSLRVALIAHTLAIIANRLYGRRVDPDRTAALALYHDAAEVLTGDLPAPVKHGNPEIKTAYGALERAAARRLYEMVPDALRKDFEPLLLGDASAADDEHRAIVKAADKLCAYVKCLEEIAAGNHEFTWAEKSLREAVEAIDRPEVRYFLETFAPSCRLTLDELT